MHPILFKIGSVKIYSYGVMMVLGYFFVLGFAHYNARKIDMDENDAVDLSILTFISGILGSRIIYILLNLKQYHSFTDLLEFQKGGLSWHGGLLGGILAIFIYCKIKKYNPFKALDLLMTPTILALGIGRIGCFLNGCCYGKPTSVPWAMTFSSHRHPIPVHPTQLYEMILDFALFFFLLYWWKKRKFNGENSLIMLALYSVIRFLVEFFRYNSPNQMIVGISLAQWVSVALFVVIISVIIIIRKKIPTTLEERAQDEESKVGESKVGESKVGESEVGEQNTEDEESEDREQNTEDEESEVEESEDREQNTENGEQESDL
ncbi:MAG: prolipoprotein diacylglyceryl transferase [Candidatus Eremiobacteraeota bacterium]|nr:prolipoprotein diacylglyceryl transferase [Candidatus Eremiobacteraeota bacterium]